MNKKAFERTKFQKVGKMAMVKISAPKVEKKEVTQKQYTPFEQMMIDYDLGDLLELAKT